MILFLLGPPAAGKGIQAKLLAEALHYPSISIGATLRHLSHEDDSLKQYVDTGKLVPLSYVQELYEQLHRDHPNNIILDGALRTETQTEQLVSLWPKVQKIVILLEISEPLVYERSQIRHDTNRTKRADDTHTIISQRIQDYYHQLPGILHHLARHKIPIIAIDGSLSIESIHELIMQRISFYDHST